MSNKIYIFKYRKQPLFCCPRVDKKSIIVRLNSAFSILTCRQFDGSESQRRFNFFFIFPPPLSLSHTPFSPPSLPPHWVSLSFFPVQTAAFDEVTIKRLHLQWIFPKSLCHSKLFSSEIAALLCSLSLRLLARREQAADEAADWRTSSWHSAFIKNILTVTLTAHFAPSNSKETWSYHLSRWMFSHKDQNIRRKRWILGYF